MRISDGSSDVCSSDLLAAGTHTEIAIDAGIQVHRHRGMAEVGLPLLAHREAALGDADVGSPVPELALWIVRGLALRLVGDQPLEHHGARLLRSEEHTSEIQSLMPHSYAGLCLKKTHKIQI